MKKAVGTSLLIIALNSLIGFTGDIGHFNIDWKFLSFITLIAVAGIFIAGFLAKKIEGGEIKKSVWLVYFSNRGLYLSYRNIFSLT